MDLSTARQLFLSICERLHTNVHNKTSDQTTSVRELPADSYRDPDRFERELQLIFKEVPLLVALTCDIPAAGDYMTMNMAGYPLLIVRGDDGRARVFLNICRHRGAALTSEAHGNKQLFVCPYHAWSYDRQGLLKGISDEKTFGAVDVESLIELPSDEAVGAIFCSLNPAKSFTAEAWLNDDMFASLAALRLEEMHPYRKTTTLESPNWKLAADGYLDGYHIGYLHRNTIGRKSITNRNTYDLFGPHMRIGFASKGIHQIKTVPLEDINLPECMGLVHYIFPNVSISGGHGDTIQLSRLFPGPAVDQSTTLQHQYFRTPVEGEMLEAAEEKRLIYEEVVRDEDCETIFTISDALDAMADHSVIFGKNEPANQHLHNTIEDMTRG